MAVLSLFGMINWIYTWHNPRIDADAGEISREMGDIFLRGVMASGNSEARRDEPMTPWLLCREFLAARFNAKPHKA